MAQSDGFVDTGRVDVRRARREELAAVHALEEEYTESDESLAELVGR